MSSPLSRMQRTARPCLKQKKRKSGKLYTFWEVLSGDYITLSESWSAIHIHYRTTALLSPGCADLRHAQWPPLPLGLGTIPGIRYLCKGGSWVSGALRYCFGSIFHCDNNLCYKETVPRLHYRLVTNGGAQGVSDYQVLPERTGLESRSFCFMG